MEELLALFASKLKMDYTVLIAIYGITFILTDQIKIYLRISGVKVQVASVGIGMIVGVLYLMPTKDLPTGRELLNMILTSMATGCVAVLTGFLRTKAQERQSLKEDSASTSPLAAAKP